MNERKLSDFCTALLAVSFLVRVLLATGVSARLDEAVQEAAAARLPPPQTEIADEPAELRVWPVYLATSSPLEQAPEPLPVEVAALPPEPEETAAPPLTFSPEEADAIAITGVSTYEVDKRALLMQPATFGTEEAEGPRVLIVHTHTSEAYTQEAGWFYDASEAFRTQDDDYSVVRVGAEIKAVLEESGIETLHDTALNDHPSYDGAYERMRGKIEGYLAEYPSIEVVLDVHRDAAPDLDGGQVDFTVEVNGEPCAQVMLVVGTDEGGLTHPNWRENLANALKLQAILNRAYPNLCRDINLRTERFNQHTSPCALLAEFGAAGNTLREALAAGRHFAEGLAVLLLSG